MMNNMVDLDTFIAELKKCQECRLDDLEDIHVDLDDLETQISMAEAVLVNYQKHFGIPVRLHNAIQNTKLQQKFVGLSIKEMLVRIAIDSAGVLNLAEARSILVRAGMFKDARNATTSIVPILSRHAQTFRRVGRGIYVLIGSQQDFEAAHDPLACVTREEPSLHTNQPASIHTSESWKPQIIKRGSPF